MDRDLVNELVQFAYQYIHDHAPQLAGEGDGWVLVEVNGQENPRREAAAEEGDARREPAVEREVRKVDAFAEEEEDGPRLQYPPDENGDLYGPIFASDSQPSAAAGAHAGTDIQPSYAAPLLISAAGDGSEVAVAAGSVVGTGKWVAEDEPETSAAAADRKGKAKVVDDEDDENERAMRKKLKMLEAATEGAEREGKGIVIRDQDLEAEAKVPTETDKSKSDQVNTQTEALKLWSILFCLLLYAEVPKSNVGKKTQTMLKSIPNSNEAVDTSMPNISNEHIYPCQQQILAHATSFPYVPPPNMTVPDLSNMTMPGVPDNALPIPTVPNATVPEMSNITMPDGPTMMLPGPFMPNPTTGPTMPNPTTGPAGPNVSMPDLSNMTVPDMSNMTVSSLPRINTLPGPTTGPTMPNLTIGPTMPNWATGPAELNATVPSVLNIDCSEYNCADVANITVPNMPNVMFPVQNPAAEPQMDLSSPNLPDSENEDGA